MSQDHNHLNHATWECKYHVVFTPKYRKKVLFGQIRRHLGTVFHELARRKEMPDQGGAPDGRPLRNFLSHKFWARGYFVSTVGRDEEVIRAYIRNQETANKQFGPVAIEACVLIKSNLLS